ncbi:hypothetical protein Nmel_011447 [Mimus melanotis]
MPRPFPAARASSAASTGSASLRFGSARPGPARPVPPPGVVSSERSPAPATHPRRPQRSHLGGSARQPQRLRRGGARAAGAVPAGRPLSRAPGEALASPRLAPLLRRELRAGSCPPPARARAAAACDRPGPFARAPAASVPQAWPVCCLFAECPKPAPITYISHLLAENPMQTGTLRLIRCKPGSP